MSTSNRLLTTGIRTLSSGVAYAADGSSTTAPVKPGTPATDSQEPQDPSGSPPDEDQSYTISALPASGEVKLRGMVVSAPDQGTFDLQDPTGTVKVALPTSQQLSLTQLSLMKGVMVTVYGRMTEGGQQRLIAASHVTVESMPTAGKGG